MRANKVLLIELVKKIFRQGSLSILLLSFSVFAFAQREGFDHVESESRRNALLAEIESLRQYDERRKEPELKSVQESLLLNDNKESEPMVAHSEPELIDYAKVPLKKVDPFVCDESNQYDCVTQKFIYQKQNEPPRIFFYDGQYKVIVYFRNTSNYPTKNSREEYFFELPKEETSVISEAIFVEYLGLDYASLKPEVTNVQNELVGLSIFVDSSDELNRFVDDNRVRAITHIGNAFEGIIEEN